MSRYFSRRHYRFVSPPADTPEQAAARRRHNEALARAREALAARYPTITPENAEEVLAYQGELLRRAEEEAR